MRLIALSTLKAFWKVPKYNDSEQALKSWHDEVKHAKWQTPQDIKEQYGNASFVSNNRVVFNIHGNK